MAGKMNDPLREALEFGMWSWAGPTNDAEVKMLEEQIEAAWQDFKKQNTALAATPAVVVPNEPTPEMLVAGRMADEDCDMPGQVYRAMIAAAPAHTATPAVGGEIEDWQWRHKDAHQNAYWSRWKRIAGSIEEFRELWKDNMVGNTKKSAVEVRPLYAAQPASPLRVTGAINLVEEAACLIWSELCPDMVMGDDDIPHYENAAKAVLALASPLRGREALVRVTASLAATISLLERTPKAKKAAPSDTMFAQMLDDYHRSLELGLAALSALPPEQPADPLSDLVEGFAKALLAKLRLASANGRSGWERNDWEKQCQQGLLRHLEKGDPRDVAAYCAFMWYHDWITAPPEQPASPLRGREAALQQALESCRTSYCGYAITDQDQYRELLGKFWKEIKRIDGIARAALASPPEQPADTAVEMYSDALKAANRRIAELEDKLWKATLPPETP